MISNRFVLISLVALALFAVLLRAEQPTTAQSQRLQFRLVTDAQPDAPADDLPDPTDATGQTTLHVLREPIIDGSDVSGVHLENTEGVNDLTIIIEMKPSGADRLGAATEANGGRRLAIVLDGKVIIAPMIMGRVAERVSISQANPNQEQLTRLAQRLNDIVATRVQMNIPTTAPTTAPSIPSTEPAHP
jgi:preprotein translocase subunit SecD